MADDVIDRLKLPDFHPVIFANGEDDDLPGIVAALENKPVYFLEEPYEPGAPIIVEFKHVALSNYIAVENKSRKVVALIGIGVGAPRIVRIKGDRPEREIQFMYCTFFPFDGRTKP